MHCSAGHQRDWIVVTQSRKHEAQQLGSRIRELRNEREITLRELAQHTNITESFLSQVERGAANPSVATLRRIADGLNADMAAMFSGDNPGGMVVRSGDRRLMQHPPGLLEDRIVTPPTAKRLEIILSEVAPGESSGEEPYTHGADEECIIILSGRLAIEVLGMEYQLDEGDTLLITPSDPHRYYNPGTDYAEALWVMSPPIY